MPVVPDRRTLTVLALVIAGMTLTSALLLLLEPGPMTPMTGVSLQSIDQSTVRAPEDRLLATTEPIVEGRWKALIIHDSGTQSGSIRELSRLHDRLHGGLTYHFVIGNGTGGPDGEIEMGFRWQRQYPGQFLQGPNADAWLRSSIGICLIGDGDRGSFSERQMRELVWLVRLMQERFNIPDDLVVIDIGQGDQPSPVFPYAWFRQQLRGAAGH